MKNGVKQAVVKGIDRVPYDLSSWSMTCGAIGSLQTIKALPVIAGDSIDIDLKSVFRLSPLNRNLYLDAHVDLFAFYVPHRHVYGSNWQTFMTSGQDESVTLGTDTLAAGVRLNCVGLNVDIAATLPRWVTRPYIQIWNRYFRDPSDTAGILAEDYFTTIGDNDVSLYGIPCCHLKSLSTATVNPTLTSADYRLALDSGEVNLLQLAALKGRLQGEQARDYFSTTRYADIIKHLYGSLVNTDADQRPTLLARSRQWLSGYDVDGTADANLGNFGGKAQALCSLRVPSRFMPEHGTILIQALVRFPYVHGYETHYLSRKSEPTYLEIAGDPEAIMRQAPITLNETDCFTNSSSVNLGDIPYAQWYRRDPSFVHRKYLDVEGHPFLEYMPTTRVDGLYISSTRYDEVFKNQALKHWNSQSKLTITAKRYVPTPLTSVFAGANS